MTMQLSRFLLKFSRYLTLFGILSVLVDYIAVITFKVINMVAVAASCVKYSFTQRVFAVASSIDDYRMEEHSTVPYTFYYIPYPQ